MAARGMHAFVRGRVHGVGFRAFAVGEARSLGLRGWARNCPDGSVEVVAWGEPLQLDVLAARLAVGPALARVDAVERTDLDSPPDVAEFSVHW